MPLHSREGPKAYKTQLQLLISANHILHHHGLVDAFGHISIRNPLNSSEYIIAQYNPGAPALVSSLDDFIEYNVDDSTPAYEPQPKGYSERFIHGEIFRRFPSVNCIVHSHSEKVISFTVAGATIKPVFHMAGFLGAEGPPIFDATGVYNNEYPHEKDYQPDMLVKNALLGTHLADKFSKIPDSKTLDYPVVLQRKHGFTCVGDSIQNAVYRAIYLQKNCVLMKDAMDLNSGRLSNLDYLTPEEAEACAKMNEATADKAFRLWLREVEVNLLYRNEEGVPKELPVGGMKEG
ncbi:arad-like aldolase/epimerase [Zopfia rhizophila CBS 207.26]|uniref:Arad-like aldolase/epimerase n=1 Tax=Zopfia rhizophila CBS 207.26 TaxID=1314779 RepID=A0A6A6ESE6_9PEZI|nr:arad-like aldolase/epimerase [Zopfia rhizophila CBS 207.26]